MKKSEIKPVLFDLIVQSIGVKKEDVTLESKFKDDFGADSLDITELMVNIDEKFSVKVPNEAVMKFSTVKDVLMYLESAHKE